MDKEVLLKYLKEEEEKAVSSFSGWDFSYLDGRWSDEDLPWDYKEIVLNALTLLEWNYDGVFPIDTPSIPKLGFISVIVIDTNANLKIIRDEAWKFQFVPIVTKECEG